MLKITEGVRNCVTTQMISYNRPLFNINNKTIIEFGFRMI
jgi:hypothetical protein